MMGYIERSGVLHSLITLTGIEDEKTLQKATETVRDYPAADVRPVVHGKWEQKAEQVANDYWVSWFCSECGYERTRGWAHTKEGRKPRAYVCEICGADLREET